MSCKLSSALGVGGTHCGVVEVVVQVLDGPFARDNGLDKEAKH